MPAQRVMTGAMAAGVRIAVAESLTGGLLMATLIDVPGASRVITGGVVAYDTELKHRVLGVPEDLLARTGPVDPDVAIHMADGIRERCRTDAHGTPDIGVATTGVAGPDPDPASGAPAGTVWLGMSSRRGKRARELRLSGTRLEIRRATVEAACEELLREISALSQT